MSGVSERTANFPGMAASESNGSSQKLVMESQKTVEEKAEDMITSPVNNVFRGGSISPPTDHVEDEEQKHDEEAQEVKGVPQIQDEIKIHITAVDSPEQQQNNQESLPVFEPQVPLSSAQLGVPDNDTPRSNMRDQEKPQDQSPLPPQTLPVQPI